MKSTFTTTLKTAVPDIAHLASQVLDEAYEKYNGYFTLTVETVKKDGTTEQNRTFHALLGAFWLTGCASYENYETMRDSFKLRAAGAKEYRVLTDHGIITTTDLSKYNGCRSVDVPKSWTEFTRQERTDAIEMVLGEIAESGASSRKLDEIIGGMER
jgi:hypothetical protein